jgi:hypothetical protein
MRRLRDWWRARRWPWWPDAMEVARDLDAEARATFSDDKALGLGRLSSAPGESPTTLTSSVRVSDALPLYGAAFPQVGANRQGRS